MLNQVILIGRLVKKPELRESENGKNYLKATLAVQSDYRKKDGEYETDFLEFTAFGKVAENTAKYCDKGRVTMFTKIKMVLIIIKCQLLLLKSHF